MLFSSISLVASFLALSKFSIAQTTTSCPAIVSEIPTLTSLTLTTETTRTFYQYLPPAYTGGASQTPLPVIVSFHGASRNATQQAGLDRFWDPDFQGSTPYIVIYAQAHKTTWEGTPNIPYNDTGYTTNIINQIKDNLVIDPNRIFASGKSDGGGFVNVLACHGALGVFAAFAPVSGAFYTFNETADNTPTASGGTCNASVVDTNLYLSSSSPPASHSCTQSATVTFTVSATPTVATRVPPILEFHGGKDKTIPYAGGLGRDNFCLPAIPHWVQDWASRDGLAVTSSTSAVSSQATAFIYGSGDTEGLVTHVFDGASVGHSWPATFFNDDNQPKNCGDMNGNGDLPASFNATPMIISFFNDWPLTRLT